jgi:Fe-S-cluster containining protein
MPAEFTDEEEELFNEIGASVMKRMRKARNPGDLLSILRTAHKQFDRAYATAADSVRATVACRSGCDACCHVPVGVQAHEVLIVAQFIQTQFNPEALEAVIARTAAHRAAFAGRTMAERATLRTPCVLLREGSCSVYEARPEACRSHHSHSAAGCGQNLEAGREEIDVYVMGMRGRMFAVMLGIDQGVAEAGFDGRAYDLGSALHEALTDSLCAVRWTQRKPAFSDSCWEDVTENSDEDDEGVIRAEGFFQ